MVLMAGTTPRRSAALLAEVSDRARACASAERALCDARRARDQAIKAAGAVHSRRTVAKAAGLDGSRVQRIIAAPEPSLMSNLLAALDGRSHA